jgi:hypothetical protein
MAYCGFEIGPPWLRAIKQPHDLWQGFSITLTAHVNRQQLYVFEFVGSDFEMK